MSESKFKTLRHIETVRNFLNLIIKELLERQEKHDQTKTESPEMEIFEIYTEKLRNCVYGSDEYKKYLEEMGIALEHHYANNRHHPEYFWHKDTEALINGISPIKDMNLIDIIEMLCDWKAATLRHNSGDIYKSLDINQKKFFYSDELKQIFKNTIDWIEKQKTFHKANES